jgi:hypothetical protein
MIGKQLPERSPAEGVPAAAELGCPPVHPRITRVPGRAAALVVLNLDAKEGAGPRGRDRVDEDVER